MEKEKSKKQKEKDREKFKEGIGAPRPAPGSDLEALLEGRPPYNKMMLVDREQLYQQRLRDNPRKGDGKPRADDIGQPQLRPGSELQQIRDGTGRFKDEFVDREGRHQDEIRRQKLRDEQNRQRLRDEQNRPSGR